MLLQFHKIQNGYFNYFSTEKKYFFYSFEIKWTNELKSIADNEKAFPTMQDSGTAVSCIGGKENNVMLGIASC